MYHSQAARHLLTPKVIYVLNYLHSNHRHLLPTYCVWVQLDISSCDTLSFPMVALKILCADAFWFLFGGCWSEAEGGRWCGNFFLGGGGEEGRKGNSLVFEGHFRSMNIPPIKEEGYYA